MSNSRYCLRCGDKLETFQVMTDIAMSKSYYAYLLYCDNVDCPHYSLAVMGGLPQERRGEFAKNNAHHIEKLKEALSNTEEKE